MPKIIVTERLADTLKILRTQNCVKSKDLAQHLGKTPGYITKLEKQEIKSIELETVESIFSFILGDDYQKTEVCEQIYASLQMKYSKAEIDEEIWFTNFDTVYRHLPIPESLIDYINDKLIALNLSRDILLQRINANEAISDEELNDTTIKPNIWYPSRSGRGSSIKISMSESLLSSILDKRVSSSPYVFIFCILYYLLKIEKYGNTIRIDELEIKELNKTATLILNSHKFYSIIERESLVTGAQSKEELQNLLSSFDNQNRELISEIFNKLKYASEIDIKITNDRLSAFLKNLNIDMWFTLKLISLDYYLLDDLEIAQRKEFINDLKALINTYTISQKKRKRTETY